MLSGRGKVLLLMYPFMFSDLFFRKLSHFSLFFFYFLSKSMCAFGGETDGFKLEPADKSGVEM